MNHDLGPTAGLLAESSATGSASSSFLSPDGGGSRNSPDGGGSAGPRRSGILMEALIKSHGGLTSGREEDEEEDDAVAAAAEPAKLATDVVVSEEATARAGPDLLPSAQAALDPSAAPKVKKSRLFRWDPAVRIDLIKSGVLSTLKFGDATVSDEAGVTLYEVTDPAEAKWEEGSATDRRRRSLLKEQVKLVRAHTPKRADRLAEIYAQMDDLWPFWESALHITSAAAPRTMELIQITLLLSHSIVMQIKHKIACPRPSDVSFRVLPMIEVPGHSSFPSGHATAAYALSETLVLLLGLKSKPAHLKLAALLRRLAFRVAQNREVAGVHYPIDSVAGQLLGSTLAEYLAASGDQAGGEVRRWRFDAAQLKAEGSESLAKRAKDLDVAGLAATKDGQMSLLGKARAPSHALLTELWSAAETEIKALPLRYL